jgi:hypothetical protein
MENALKDGMQRRFTNKGENRETIAGSLPALKNRASTVALHSSGHGSESTELAEIRSDIYGA